MSLCPTSKFSVCDTYNMFCAVVIEYFTQNLFKFYLNSIQYDRLITVETII